MKINHSRPQRFEKYFIEAFVILLIAFSISSWALQSLTSSSAISIIVCVLGRYLLLCSLATSFWFLMKSDIISLSVKMLVYKRSLGSACGISYDFLAFCVAFKNCGFFFIEVVCSCTPQMVRSFQSQVPCSHPVHFVFFRISLLHSIWEIC